MPAILASECLYVSRVQVIRSIPIGYLFMSKAVYLAGDFSGIQRYVLGVKSAGKAQAKRLRARSFLLELFEHAALWTIKERLCIADDDVLVRGGGGFLIRIPPDTDPVRLEEIRSGLQRKLWDESGGEIHLSLGWAETPLTARARLEVQKCRIGFSMLQSSGGWNPEGWCQPPLDKPCEVCRQAPGQQSVQEDEGEEVLHCRSCLEARKLGENLTRWKWMRPGGSSVRVLGVAFETLEIQTPESFQVGRWIPRHSDSREPLTFQEIAAQARNDRRLAVLKADVDDMGVRVGQIAGEDRSYSRLRSFSYSLHEFFGQTIQELLAKSWPLIYTLYAGGDDLLLVGPWNVVLDFAGTLAREFETGPAQEYSPLTLSAGIALTSYRVPIRHAVECAEELLESAKERPGKNRCAALGADWSWRQHKPVVGDGKRLADWVEAGVAPRSLLHRLLRLAESAKPLSAARWAYQIERNVPRRHTDFHRWANHVLEYIERDGQRVNELAASLRYALLATRPQKEGRDD